MTVLLKIKEPWEGSGQGGVEGSFSRTNVVGNVRSLWRGNIVQLLTSWT